MDNVFDKQGFSELMKIAIGDRSINEYGRQCGVSSAHISRLLREMIDTPPNPSTIRKFSDNSEGRVAYEQLLNLAGHINSVIQDNINNKLLKLLDNCRTLSDEHVEILTQIAKEFKKI